MTTFRSAIPAIGLLAMGGALACTRPAAESFNQPIVADSAEAVQRAQLQPGALMLVQSEPADIAPYPNEHPFEVALRTSERRTGHARRFGSITREITLRTRPTDPRQEPCTSCHLGVTVTMAETRVADAHQNIDPVHPQATGAVCSTCHAPDNVERLAVKSGERPTLDHAYRLCMQCHAPQFASWAGGAHGKRLDGWQGRRVVMGCADCHDPHDPSLKPRVPFRAPRLPTNQDHNR